MSAPNPSVLQGCIRFLRILYLESVMEFLKCLRTPAFTTSLLALPIMIYVVMGLLVRWSGSDAEPATYWTVTAASIGVMGTGLFGFGVYVATERGQGWLLLKRVSPMPVLVYFLGKGVMSVMFSAWITLIILMLAWTVGSAEISITRGCLIVLVISVSTLPFCSLGLVLGYLVGPNSAHALVNIIYLPLLAFSGVLIPIDNYGTLLQQLCYGIPSFHTTQIALKTINASLGQSLFLHISVTVGYTMVFLIIALYLFGRDEGKTYG